MAPLMVGANVRNLNAFDLETYTNSEVIAVNQDRLANQGRRVMNLSYSAPGAYPQLTVSVWARELSGGRLAMVFVNNFNATQTIVCHSGCWAQIRIKAGTRFHVRDVWSHTTALTGNAVSGRDYKVNVEAGDGTSKMFLFIPQPTILV